MDKKVSKFFDSVGDFFSSSQKIPWCDRDIVAGCERDVAEGDSSEKRNESILRFSWSLVHSRQPEDVQRGIAMLEASVNKSKNVSERREKLYLLAVGYYRSGDYLRSRQLIDQCLELQPQWGQALTLKKVVKDKIAKEGLVGIGIAATAVGLLAGGIAAIARSR